MHALPLLAALLTLAVPPERVPSPRVPSPEEQKLFDEGTRAFSSGDAQAAEKAWQAGYALGRDPAFLVHIGEAQEKAGAPAQATASYRRYLQQVPDASDRADIEQRLARLAPATPPTAAAPAIPAEPTGDFGATPPAMPAPATAVPPAVPAPRADAEHPPGPPPETSGWSRYNVTAVVATAVTVALLGTAGFFAAAAGSQRDNINRLVMFHDPATGAPLPYSSVAAQYTQSVSDGRRDDRIAKGVLIGAGAGAAVAALFFVLDATLTHEPMVAVAPAGGGLAALGGWTWRW